MRPGAELASTGMAVILVEAAVTWTAGAAAAITVVGATVAAWLVDLLLRGAERRLAQRSGVASLDAAGHTRLRVVRRLLFAVIISAGLFLALLQFDSFDRLASAALASGALISAVVGFAARDTLGSAVAGVSLAITQPIRVGDVIAVGDLRGTVDDVTLTATWIRTPDGSRAIVPNQVVTTSVVRNDSIGGAPVTPSASVWIAATADDAAALAALAALPGATGSAVEETAVGGIRVSVDGAPVAATERATTERALRAAALAALRAAGIERNGPDPA